VKYNSVLSVWFLVIFFSTFSVSYAIEPSYPWLLPNGYKPEQTIGKRVISPESFKRLEVEGGSFAKWLRWLPLKPDGSPVLYHDGRVRKNAAQVGVVKMGILGRNQECADAIIRLRSEYLWSVERADEICFNFSNGEPCCWKWWRIGRRPRVEGNKVSWIQTEGNSDSREVFIEYLKKVFKYAGTASLSNELVSISPDQLQIGDIIIWGGFPGHAVLVLDMVENLRGEKMMLLGQSYMPAQDFHVLKNPQSNGSPWYKVNFDNRLVTPDWTFNKTRCRKSNCLFKRFPF